jgi:radical SAM protein with 4Fe4S-binding SPASM domain
VAANAAPRIPAQVRAARAGASAALRTTARAVAANAALLIPAQVRAARARASVARPTNALAAAENVEVRIPVPERVVEEKVNAARPTTVLEAVANAVRPMNAQEHDLPFVMREKWRLPDCVTRIDRDDKVLLFNARVPSWLVTNANGALLLSLCDGQNTIDDIVEAYIQNEGAEHEEEVRRFFVLAQQSGLFIDVPPEPVKNVSQRLSHVQLSISSSCNLHCRYCYATDRREGTYAKLSLSDYQRLVDDILTVSDDVFFSLTGGEPLLHPDCLAIGEYITQKGCGVDLLTNATLISEKNIEDICRIFSCVSISMDGSTAERHDFYRGKGSFERTEKAILLLEQHGMDYGLSMTVNRKNLDDVERMAEKYGRRLTFQPLFPAGSAKRGEDLSITGREYYEVLKKAHGVNPLSYCEATLDESRYAKRHKCAIGGAELSISPTGDVYPCQLLHYPSFLIGNVHEQPLSELVQASPVISQCAAMTVDNIEGCSACFLRYVCGGACRARAFHESGDIMTCGSFCEYEREAYINGILSLFSENAVE